MRFVLLFALAGSSCRDPASEDLPTSSELRDRAGCDDLPSPFTSLELTETDIATVPRLEWTSDLPVTPTLILDPGDGSMVETPGESEASTHGQFLALGTPPLRTGTTLLAVDTDSGRACSATQTFDTHLLSTALPELTLSVHEPLQSQGAFMLVDLITESQSFITIINAKGEYVWAYPIKGGPNVAQGLDRQTVLYFEGDPEASGSDGISTTANSRVSRVGLDGQVLDTVVMPGLHMDFVERSDGGFAGLGFETREFVDNTGATRFLVGDTLMIASPEGEVETLWSAFDGIDPDLDEYYPWGFFEVENMEDWTHGNGMDYDPDADAYFVSLAGIHAYVRVDGSTGTLDWILRSEGGDFPDDTDSVQAPHSIQHLGDDRILVFNRNIVYGEDLPDDTDVCSQASELQLDMDSLSVDQLWSYGSEECLWVVFFGEAHRLESGNTTVIFSSAGQIDETNAEGETVWRVNTDVGGAFGFGEPVDSFRLDSTLPP